MHKSYKDTFLIPITFGITGHRDIIPEDMNRAKECISVVIKSFRRRFPNSPLLFLSPLAQGADCLAAKAALDTDKNVYLQTIYPFAIEKYKKTISPEWIESFNELHNHERTIGFHIVNTSSSDLTVEERDLAYLQTGEFIATHSHILFALKNKQDSGKFGGTAEIVEYRKRGCVDLLEVDDSNIRCAEKGLLYEIRVRRLSDANEPAPTSQDDKYFITPAKEDERNEKQVMASLGITEPNYADSAVSKAKGLIGKTQGSIPLLGGIDFLNQASKKLMSNFRELVKTKPPEQNWATEELYNILKSENAEEPKTENTYTRHIKAVCDYIASDYQRKYRLCLYWVFALSALAGLLHGFESYLEVIPFLDDHPSSKYFFAGGAFLVWIVAKVKGYKHTYEEYRALSEALRVQDYWYKSGIQKSPADFFLSTQIGDNSWIRRAIRTVWLLDFPKLINPETIKETGELDNLKLIERSWIEDQIVYLTKKIEDFEIKTKRFGRLSSALFGIGVLFLFLGNKFVYSKLGTPPLEAEFFNSVGTTSLIMLALVKTFVEMNAYEVLIKRFEASLHVYSQCKKIYGQLIKLTLMQASTNGIDVNSRIRMLYLTLGRFVLDEVSDWYNVNSKIEFKNPAKE